MLKFESAHGYPFHGRTVRYMATVNPVRKLELVDKGYLRALPLSYMPLRARLDSNQRPRHYQGDGTLICHRVSLQGPPLRMDTAVNHIITKECQSI